tara:strand:- start:266 stop:664 length:399 start_codon:yes stop_codon:yes gene_type:complete
MNVDDGRVVSNFIISALRDESLVINGNGNQTRSFCYIDDTINGITKLMNSKKSINGPVNIGSNKETTIKSLAKTIIKLTNSNSKIVYKNKVEDDPVKRKPSLKLAENLLNWHQKISLNKGLEKTIEYFQKSK